MDSGGIPPNWRPFPDKDGDYWQWQATELRAKLTAVINESDALATKLARLEKAYGILRDAFYILNRYHGGDGTVTREMVFEALGKRDEAERVREGK